MRSKNALINLIAYFMYEAVLFAVGIVFPRYIIMTFGSEVNGLTSTITRLLSLVNLIQAGAVGAAVYEMYKPVADSDCETQSAIIYASRRFYNAIAIIYIIASLLLGIGYGFYLRNDNLSFQEILLSFITLGVSGSFALFVTSYCDIFLSPHQKSYFLKISAFANIIVHYGLLALVLIKKTHFIFIYLAIFCGNLVNAILNLIFYKKQSKGIISKSPKEKHYQIPNRKYLMFSAIGTEAVTASSTVIITTFSGLASASVFSIYSMIFVSMKTILNAIQYSISPIFGNVVKTSDDRHIRDVYDCIELVSLLLGSLVSICLGFLLTPFIKVYTSGISDINYYYQALVILVTIYVLAIAIRVSFGFVATVYGLFKLTCKITLLFGLIGIMVSLLCVILFGFPYVMCGLILNEIGCLVATMIILKKNISWYSSSNLILRASVMVMLTVLSSVVYLAIKPEIASIWMWISYAIVVGLVSVVILLVYCLLFERKNMHLFLLYAKKIIIKKRKTEE